MHTGGCAAQDVCDGDCSTTTKPPRAQTAALTTAGREFVVPFGEPCSHGSSLCVVRVRIGVSMMLMGRCQFFFYPIPRLAPQVFFFERRHCAAVVTARQHVSSEYKGEDEELALTLPMRDKLPMANA
ncbi:hypothetical protein COCVIDRAFT_94933 [Bipolaris victoriae FI3]|uniref:Uncharacterized protein n=1 Tax=Bipolaris victoriae (strain FI3) TaxID=930091 RepID=W7EKZ9_BIPV3|nr:hypothetical protein COCVIDRAFT_94933 [Bipolaris victoriae FI3]